MPLPLLGAIAGGAGRLASAYALQELLAKGIDTAGDFAESQGWQGTADVLHNDFLQNTLPGVATGGFGLLKSGGMGLLRNPSFYKELGKAGVNEVSQNLAIDKGIELGMPLVAGMLGANQQSQPKTSSSSNKPSTPNYIWQGEIPPEILQMYLIERLNSSRTLQRNDPPSSPSMEAVQQRYKTLKAPEVEKTNWDEYFADNAQNSNYGEYF